MSQKQKQVLKLNDPKVIKAIQKPFARQIIECFYKTPLTASEVAEAVSFPKDKIYYHIKKLLAIDILYIAESEKVKGIEQNKYLPVAEQILFDDQVIGSIPHSKDEVIPSEKLEEEKGEIETAPEETDETKSDIDQEQTVNPLLENLLKKRSMKPPLVSTTPDIIESKDKTVLDQETVEEPAFKRTIEDRRRSSDRRDEDGRRDEQDRRIKQILNYEGEDRREKNRRSGKEQRSRSSRREARDRRLLKEDYQPDPVTLKMEDHPEKDSKQSLLVNNARLHLNGVTPVSYTHLTLPTILLV